MDNILAFNLYVMDAIEYLGVNSMDELKNISERYNLKDFTEYQFDLDKYYSSRGNEQLARQVLFHSTDHMKEQFSFFLKSINTNIHGYGVDVGCGSAPVGFELALRGHDMDLIDIDGAGAYEFVKWRTKKRNLSNRIKFEFNGPYDYAFFLDSIEHFQNLEEILENTFKRLKQNAAVITNYFFNMDYKNPEHINMNKKQVLNLFKKNGITRINDWVFEKTGG